MTAVTDVTAVAAEYDDSPVVRRELEEAIDILEMWSGGEPDQIAQIIAAYLDPVERSRLAQRLYDLSESLETFALAIWP